ncbi:hypothetical protein EAH84_06210 [Sphingomonas oligophenolica]|uniref:Glycosyltransferase RgtA/B/C/D-like domain-containing protein n=2 Tax=Sphingomonas oligophenolica TaxID=301154 RepID=A0A502CJ48_9SPHN|nr:hypothetical protein EAH84_06210 [Sphingomonas oligophenolica]
MILLAAILLRVWDVGNPVIHVDEQYYLLVGDRLLHGAIPYVDIWDRKPIGLFLIYAAIRLLPGDGIVAYQLVAMAAAALTALLVVRGGRMLGATARGATVAGIAYLILLELLGGRGGQAPVFYNLPVTAAALLTLRLPNLAERRDGRAIVANGLLACLFAGLAIQIKYTAAVEGAFVGIAHLWFLHRARARWGPIVGAAIGWGLVGLAPTLCVVGWYAAHGDLAAFWFANFASIGLRAGYPAGQLAMRLLGILAQILPLIVGAALAWRWRVAPARHRIALAWLAAAVVGFGAIGTFFAHYALPLVAPLAILAAVALGRSTWLLVATLVLGLGLWGIELVVRPDDAAGARAVAHVVAANHRGACPYVFIGDTITYRLADACVPSAYAFPNLLAYSTEQGATGIDEAAEVRRILATRPPLIVTSDRRLSIWNRASVTAEQRALATDYRPVLRVPRSGWHSWVFLRRDLAFRR